MKLFMLRTCGCSMKCLKAILNCGILLLAVYIYTMLWNIMISGYANNCLMAFLCYAQAECHFNQRLCFEWILDALTSVLQMAGIP